MLHQIRLPSDELSVGYQEEVKKKHRKCERKTAPTGDYSIVYIADRWIWWFKTSNNKWRGMSTKVSKVFSLVMSCKHHPYAFYHFIC